MQTNKFDPNATPECDSLAYTIGKNNVSVIEGFQKWVAEAEKQEKSKRVCEHENAKLKEQLRIAIEALAKIEDANGMWVTLFAEETLKQIEEVGR